MISIRNMKPITSIAVPILFMVLMVVFLVVFSINTLWGKGADLAHHYALVARLSESGSIPYTGDPSLGEMNYYPRSSHYMAALVGRFFNSALLGMQLTALLSVVLIWTGFITILLSIPKKSSYVAAFILLSTLWINHFYVHIELHADEVVQNYFFAQLVAQAFIIFIISLTIYIEHIEVKPTLRYVLIVASIYITVGIHLLPAMELLLFFIGMLVVDLYQQRQLTYISWKNIILAALLALIATTLLVLHPTFAIMQNLSGNNGNIATRYIQSMNAFLAYSLIHFLMSCYLLRLWLIHDFGKSSRQWIALKNIGQYGLAGSGLCLLQVIAFKFGHGSEYAVKKHIFALNTTFLIELIIFLAFIIYRIEFFNKRLSRLDVIDKFSPYFLAPFLTVATFFLVTPFTARLDTSRMVALEHQLKTFQNLAIPSIPRKFNYVVGVNGIPPDVAYMMSIGVLKAPRFPSTESIMSGRWNADWEHVNTLVTSENSVFDRYPICRRTVPSNSLVLLDGKCLGEMRKSSMNIGFTINDGANSCVTTGMSDPENFGTWTDGHVASIHCPLPENASKKNHTLKITAFAFLNHVKLQRVRIGINDASAVEYQFDSAQTTKIMSLDLPSVTEKEIKIIFNLPDAVSPKELDISKDPRKLGIAISNIEFE